MPVLEIHFPTGRSEIREITRDAPLIVGRMPHCDIRIDAEGVAPIQCRISWARGNFEVTSVASEGIEWNGALVQQAIFSPGDVVRIGDVEIMMQGDGERTRKPSKKPERPAVPPAKREPHSAYEVSSPRPADGSEELFKSAELDL